MNVVLPTSSSTSPLRLDRAPPRVAVLARGRDSLSWSHSQSRQEGVHVLLSADGRPVIHARNGGSESLTCGLCRSDLFAGLGTAFGQPNEFDQRCLEFANEFHHAANDLPREVLITLREKHFSK